MRKTHLRCVVDKELGVYQTACGLRITPKRPVTEYEEDITCAVCKQIVAAYTQEKAAKREAKKAKQPKPEPVPVPATDQPAAVDAPKKKTRKKKENAETAAADAPAEKPKTTRKKKAPAESEAKP